jgi:hypothetical protein
VAVTVNASRSSGSGFETSTGPVADWTAPLTAGLTHRVQASDQPLGHLEEEILHRTQGVERQLLEEAAQQKADQAPPCCPVCGHPLIIALDAWNICEREARGRTSALRRPGQESVRWHWVYGGTCFRLEQRVENARGRPCSLTIAVTRRRS